MTMFTIFNFTVPSTLVPLAIVVLVLALVAALGLGWLALRDKL